MELGSGYEADIRVKAIKRAIQDAFIIAEDPKGIGAFLRTEEGSQIKTAYFTPETEDLARSIQADPCEKPIDDGFLSYLGGDYRLPRIHFGHCT